MRPLHRLALPCFALVFLSGVLSSAQNTASKPLIVEQVNENQLVTIRGNTPPAAIAKNDRGRVSPDMRMSDLILVLRRSQEQQAAFNAFVASQYDATSPNFHQWLQPAEVGEKFGPALADIATVSSWLGIHGLSVDEISKDRMTIRFSGSAAQVEGAFHTEIHDLMVNGEPHISNMSDPQIPMALEPVVLGPKALHNFIPRPLHRVGGKAKLNPETGKWEREQTPNLASSGLRPDFGFTTCSGSPCLIEDVAPYDFATIYNVLPLWNASSPIDGTGQTIAIAGTSDVRTTDVATFRSTFGLPAGPTLITKVANGTDPGYCNAASTSTLPCTIDDQIENALDVEWSGAIAKGAQIVLVVSGANAQTTDTVYSSANYVIQNDTAPVLSVSYGLCELFLGTAGNTAYNNLWESASTAGIAVFVATGDSGSPACDQGGAQNGPYGAQYGLSVSGIASTQYDTAVGGTDLNWGGTAANPTAAPYWNTTNNTTTGSTAVGYIPEVPWDDTCTNPIIVAEINTAINANLSASQICYELAAGMITSNPEQAALNLVNTFGGGGGASNCTINSTTSTTITPNPASCSGGYAKPTWQAGVSGIPSDSLRDIPDVSFFAGDGFLGSAYLICVSDWGVCLTSPTTTAEPAVGEVGGTSAATPAMAGVMALINQKAGATQGHPNPVLYALAGKQNYSSCTTESVTASSACYFNDIDTGTNAMPCAAGSPNCTVAATGNTYGVLTGFAAGTGFDEATGLGSLNVANVVNAWPASTGTAMATVAVSASPSSITTAQGTTVTVAVTGASGTPTGTVVLTSGTFTSAAMSLTSGSASIPVAAGALAVGTDTVKASYSGDTTYAAASGTATVTVTQAPLLTPTVTVVPAQSAIVSNVSLTVTGTVSGSGGTPTGTVTLSGGGYTSSATALASGSYSITIPANSLSGGAVTLTVSYSGNSVYATASNSAVVTVTTFVLLTPTVTVAPATSTIDAGQTLSVPVTVTGAGVTPTGTVTLTGSGYTSSAPAPTLVAGAYTFTIPANSLSTGSDTLTVNYSGDTNYAAGMGSATVTVTPSAYTLAATAATVASPGGSGTSTITLTSSTDYTGTVTLTCALTTSPAGASDLPTCSPAANAGTITVTAGTPGGTGMVTVATTMATASMKRPRIGGWAEAGSGAVLALLVFFGIPARRRGWRAMLGSFILLATLGSLAACGGGGSSGGGGGGNSGTTTGSYTFTVTGTGSDPSKTTQTATFTLTVN
jgi:hypothetical protein